MMTNDQMKPGRFLRWHRTRALLERTNQHIAAGGRIIVSTYTRATIDRDAESFVAGVGGVIVRSGKALDCLTGHDGPLLVGIRFTR